MSIESNVNYTFTCTTSQNYSLENTIALCWFDENKNILSRNTKNVRGNINNYSITATSPSTAKYLIVNFIAYVDDAVFYLNEGTTTVFEPYGYKVPVVVSGKNLFNEIYPNIAINTVKYISFALTNGEYTLSSNIPNGGSASLFLLAGQVNSGASTQNNGVWLNNPQTVNVIDGFLTIGYRIYGNMNPEDYETILALGSTATDYEPYHEPTTTNIYLDEPIGENESISLSDTNTNIPTIRGTNVLTVDTTVQPSKVLIKV